MERTVRVDKRFSGPPEYANGGYICGLLARHIDGPARVRLHKPIPLETELRLTHGGGQPVTLHHGDELLVSAESAPAPPSPPPPPSLAEAVEAMTRFKGESGEPFGGCFVCGIDRRVGDALRLFAGSAGDVVAATFVPPDDLWTHDGTLSLETLFAALDCPGMYALQGDDGLTPMLLGELTGSVARVPRRAERLIAYAWRAGERVGRRERCGTALATAEGEILASAASTWFTFG